MLGFVTVVQRFFFYCFSLLLLVCLFVDFFVGLFLFVFISGFVLVLRHVRHATDVNY